MPLKVIPATDTDAPRAFEIEHLAYEAANDDLNSLLFPGPIPPEASEKRAESVLKAKAEDTSTVWLKVVDDTTNEMIAFAEWHVYPPGVKHPQTKQRMDFGPGSDPLVCQEFFGRLAERREGLMGGKNYVYLKFLHTDPKHQRRGAGSMLVKWGVDKAEELKLPAYLEASPSGKPLYLKYGFKEVDRVVFDLSRWGGKEGTTDTVVLMLKPFRI